MQSIKNLLDRIHEDTEFGRGYFEIGYFDRMKKEIIRLSFNQVTQLPGKKFSFHVFDEDGIAHCIPMHRVQEFYKDGKLIWKREPGKLK